MKHHSKNTLARLASNSRFYFLISTLCVSCIVASYLRTAIVSDQLYYIRLQQVFGGLSLIYWYVVLLISPLKSTYGPGPMLEQLVFLRRAIGVSAAGFALAHSLIALYGQLGGIGGLSLLPASFLRALIFGGITLLILVIMAATSFDRVVRWMTPARWKWLHRLGYIGGVTVLLHVWIIGSHSQYLSTKIIVGACLALLFYLESVRLTKRLARRYSDFGQKELFYTLVICIWTLLMGLLLLLPRLAPNYHAGHTSHSEIRHE
ncbi:MAG: Sulfoxide reductase heme-binding subunit YedZ [Candidatus Saccharibacteria bacterium]|nr:Sulfoxide reductase heme-binding subunit YedZ [Candidatus Saccharibacteria bacterium]